MLSTVCSLVFEEISKFFFFQIGETDNNVKLPKDMVAYCWKLSLIRQYA